MREEEYRSIEHSYSKIVGEKSNGPPRSKSDIKKKTINK